MRILLFSALFILGISLGCSAVPESAMQTGVPVVEAVFPSAVAVGSSDLMLSVSGSNFTSRAKVFLNGEKLVSYASNKHIYAIVRKKYLVVPRTLAVVVQNSSDAKSTPVSFTVGAGSPGGLQTAAGSLAIATKSLPVASIGKSYQEPLWATGGAPPYTWSMPAGSLPSGIALSATTGQLSGEAASSGTHTFIAQVTDKSGQAVTKQFSLAVQENVPIVATSSVPTASVNSGYTTSLTASGGAGPYTWILSGGNLPSGLALNATTGQIAGTPSSAGSSSFTVQVQDALGQSSSRSLSLNVNNVNVNDVPNGGTPVFSDNFESAPTYTSRGGKYLDVAHIYWASTASGGVAHSGTHSIAIYNPSAPGVLSCQGDCSVGAAPILRVPDFCCLTELWTRHWEYWATTTVATADKNGFPHHGARVRHSWDGDREYEAMIDGSGNCWSDGTHYSMQLNPDPAGKAACAVSHYDVVANKGAWHCIESHMKLNSAGAANGVLEMYVDGSSTPSATTSSANFGSNPLGIGSLSFVSNATGGNGSWPSSTNYRYIDDVAWSTSRIGCN